MDSSHVDQLAVMIQPYKDVQTAALLFNVLILAAVPVIQIHNTVTTTQKFVTTVN
jgi:hypothetical protein